MNDIINIKKKKEERLNTCVYVDYENITKQLKSYGTTPTKINFFGRVKSHLESLNLNIIDFLVYANYDDGVFTKGKCQTELQAMGLQTRHTSNKGKNSGDLELTIDALRELYKNNFIEVFVIISCDRDFIPLIKAIKSENKITYVISTKIGFNEMVVSYADDHAYIEDIFTLGMKEVAVTKLVACETNEDDISTNIIKKACKYFYKSKLYENSLKNNKEVTVIGFARQVSRVLKMSISKIETIFEKANELEYISLYKNDKNEYCLKDGNKKNEIFDKEDTIK